MEGYKILNLMLGAIIIIAVIWSFSYINSLKTKIDNMQSHITTIEQDVLDNKGITSNLRTEINSAENQLIDLWMATIPEESLAKIHTWEKDNTDFVMCDKQFKDFFLARGYYSYNGSNSKVLVYSFDKGDLVYDRDGSIKCYLTPVMDINPPSVDCMKLCAPEENANKSISV